MDKCCAVDCENEAEELYTYRFKDSPKVFVLGLCPRHQLFMKHAFAHQLGCLTKEIREEWEKSEWFSDAK